MKKPMILLIIGIMAIDLTGCKQNTARNVTEDVYASVAVNETIQAGANATSQEVLDAEVVENITEDSGTSDASIEEEAIDKETNDVKSYPIASEPIDYGIEALQSNEGTLITDEQQSETFETLIRKLYYNYFFSPSMNIETGLIEASNMTLFAISYIMQHENEGLPFDYATYQLSIPGEKVNDIVAQYFHRDLDVHKSYEEFNVDYDDEKVCYTVIIEDDQWEVDLEIDEIRQLSDTTYRIIANLPRKTSGLVEEQIETIIVYEEEVPIVIYYKIREAIDKTSNASEDETTEE